MRQLTYGVLFVGIGVCTASAQRGSSQPLLLALRLLPDSTRVDRKESVITETVQFMARNLSNKVVYGPNACGQSPKYYVERREVEGPGKEYWREVYVAECIGGEVRPLAPGDSSLLISPIAQFLGQKPEFVFSDSGDVYRFVYVVSTSPEPGSREEQIISPSVILRRPK